MSSVTLSYPCVVHSERRRCRRAIRHLALVVLLLVAGTAVGFAQCSIGSCRTNTISLNTGVQHNTGSLYTNNAFDGFWNIIADPDPQTMEPRGARVRPAYPGWPVRGGCTWLWRDTTNSTGGDSILGTTVYTTEFFVCGGGSVGNLSLSIMCPNEGRIYMNGVLLTSIPFPGYPPIVYINPGVPLLAGTNVLRIEVDNTTGMASGLNVVGSLNTAGPDLLTRQCGPQYITVHGAVKDDIDINGMDNPIDPPLGGVLVTLTDPVMGSQFANTTLTGRYWFRHGSDPGLYTVQVTPLPGYAITYNTTQTVTIAAASYATGLRTGMTSCAQVCVGKYNDLNCNGQPDPGEPTLGGWVFNFSDGQVVTSSSIPGVLVCKKVCGLSSLTVTEVIPPGSCWKNTQPGTGSYTINPIPGQSFILYFGNSSTGTLCVKKFNDRDCDGSPVGDDGIEGWQFTVTSATFSQTVTTGPDGTVCIERVTCGTYTVTEIVKPGWKNTTPTIATVVVVPCETTTATFGNSSTGSICGFKYNDVNNNGTYDPPTDMPLSGWTIELLDNAHTPLASGVTGTDGLYCFDYLPSGNYFVREVQQPGWVKTEPLAPEYSVTVTPCVEKICTFGNYHIPCTTAICITKFNDLNCNGVNDGEPQLQGWTFTVSNGLVTVSVTTGVNGVTCANVTAGTWTICEVQQAGWKITTPPCVTIAVVTCQTRSVEFGNSSTGTVCGFKYNDVNNNGTYDPFPGPDVPLSGWTIELLDNIGNPLASGVTGPDGLYCFEQLLSGDYLMREVQQANWNQTEPVAPFTTYEVEVTPCCYTVFTFGNHYVECTTAICITKFNDLNCNGVNDGEPQLQGWTFTVSNGLVTVSVTTGVNGVTCANVTAGTWTICEVQQAGWKITTPACVTIAVVTCQTRSVEFGNSSTGTVCGFKYNDVNNNGTYDPFPGPDVPLSGWTIELLDNMGNPLASGVTGPDGLYCFEQLLSGDYFMREVQQAGWNQTEPAAPFTTYNVEVTPCCYTVFTFGNHQVQCTSAICITKFNDLNGNGTREPGEPGLPGWQFNVSGGVGTVTTGSGGQVCVTVTCGTYTICEVTQPGWTPTTPVCTTITVTASAPGNVTFGNHQVTCSTLVCVTKFNDKNCDGVFNSGDELMPGWNIQVRLPGGGPVVATGVTGSDGRVCIPVTSGTYEVFEVIPPAVPPACGWVQTYPAGGGFHTVTIATCSTANIQFGNSSTGTLCIRKFNDLNCNGKWDPPTEPGLSNWRFTFTMGSNTLTLYTDKDGLICVPVTCGTWTVCEQKVSCWTPTTQSGFCRDIPVAACVPNPPVELFGNSSTSTLCITKFNDLNGNGTRDPGEPGIKDWQFTVSGVGTVVTSTDGTICIPVTCGTYTVCEVTQAGWVQTTPASTCVTITVTPCVPISITFGNHQVTTCTAMICGKKYWERPHGTQNCNGFIDPDEVGMWMWDIIIEDAGTGVIVTTGTTATDGTYCLTVPGPGLYRVKEVAKWGFMQTFPPTPPGFHTVLVKNCGDVLTGFDFLNCACPNEPCVTDSIPIQSRPAAANGNTVLVFDPSGGLVPRNGVALPPTVPVPVTPPVGGSQWIGPNPCLAPPCPDPAGTYIWRRYFCLCDGIDSTVVRIRLCFKAVDRGEVWLAGKRLAVYGFYPAGQVCIDTLVKVGKIPCPYLEFRVIRLAGRPANPAALTYEGSIVGPGLVKDSCCSCYSGGVVDPGHGLITPGEGSEGLSGADRADGGDATVTDMREAGRQLADPLLRSVPNPTSGETTVSYLLSHAGEVRLDLYNAVGRHISTLGEGHRDAGMHTVPVDLTELPSGLYHVRLLIDGRVYTLKIMSSK